MIAKIAKNVRNLRDSSQPEPTVIAQTVQRNHSENNKITPVLSINSEIRADAINSLLDQYSRLEVSAVICAAKMGDLLRQEKAEFEGTFEQFLAEKCPRLSSTTAYNRMQLAKENPELLADDALQTAGQLLKEGHYVALFSAPADVKALVHQRAHDGHITPIAEIDRLKKEAKEAKELAKRNEKKWSDTEKENIELKANIERKAIEIVKQKEEEITDKAFAAAESQLLSQITTLKQEKTTLLANLATMQRTGESQKLDAEISESEKRLSQLNLQLSNAEQNLEFRKSCTDFLNQLAKFKLTLKITGVKFDYLSIETLKLARHEINELEDKLCEIITKIDETVDIED